MTGMGRTGRFLAAEHWGIVPDVTVLAKAIGGGFPLGAFVADRTLLERLAEDPPLGHVTTFGGHPVSCAAGRAALRVLLRDRLAERAEAVGTAWREELRECLLPRGAVEVRGLGLFIGIELRDAPVTRRFVDRCRERGVLLGWTLHHDHIVRLAPPLNTPEAALAEATAVMENALRDAVG
jgi:acetylornithine/succinyldiaminopimelate/putrescine aminotransferase